MRPGNKSKNNNIDLDMTEYSQSHNSHTSRTHYHTNALQQAARHSQCIFHIHTFLAPVAPYRLHYSHNDEISNLLTVFRWARQSMHRTIMIFASIHRRPPVRSFCTLHVNFKTPLFPNKCTPRTLKCGTFSLGHLRCTFHFHHCDKFMNSTHIAHWPDLFFSKFKNYMHKQS